MCARGTHVRRSEAWVPGHLQWFLVTLVPSCVGIAVVVVARVMVRSFLIALVIGLCGLPGGVLGVVGGNGR